MRGYLVFFSGRRVLYFDRTAETHVEHFPNSHRDIVAVQSADRRGRLDNDEDGVPHGTLSGDGGPAVKAGSLDGFDAGAVPGCFGQR
jgi:hypothetical protein